MSNLSHLYFEPGATWTFVHATGKRTHYVYDRLMAEAYQDPKSGYGLSAMHALLNPDTGKFAQVTERWLREAPRNSATSESGKQSHWLPGDKAAA
jgi:hypothetical protein